MARLSSAGPLMCRWVDREMQYRAYGKTGIQISVLGFGAGRFPVARRDFDMDRVVGILVQYNLLDRHNEEVTVYAHERRLGGDIPANLRATSDRSRHRPGSAQCRALALPAPATGSADKVSVRQRRSCSRGEVSNRMFTGQDSATAKIGVVHAPARQCPRYFGWAGT